MSEGNHNTELSPAMPNRSPSKKMFLVLGGTAAAAFIAGFMLQFIRPVSGQAAENKAGKASVGGAQTDPTKYLARITNGKTVMMVSYDEVAHECMLRYGSEVLDNIINRKVIEIACEGTGIEINEAEVDQEIVKVATKFNMSVEQWYAMLQDERHVTKAQYRRDIIWPMIALRKLAGEEVKITKTELTQAFEKNYGPRVKVRIIVQDNQRRAAEAWDQVSKNPETFEAMVKKYSIDQSSRALGGAVPPIPRFSGNPLTEPIETAAFKLKAGDISSVIQSGQQFIILKCEGRTEQVVSSIEEVQGQLLAELKEEKTQRAISEKFEQVRESARIENFLTNKLTGGGTGRRPAAAQAPGQGPGQTRPANGPANAKPAVTSRPANTSKQ
ncbi:MAG: PpiC-type peptidyl-prolyl cis-trans isomerase [Planctomycetaceae bacterium]|nr:PpiC-type peptidyl-prolyl cis-trans isomerase [Planctomycetaceae bacterium]